MPIGVRTRFEIFKRDGFMCRYCGRESPDVILEVDHIVPVVEGGSDDPINLTTSCWECNRGKAGKALGVILTGEDPHDKAIALLETQRQIREYDAVVGAALEERQEDARLLLDFWCDETGTETIPRRQFAWLIRILETVPVTVIKEAMIVAVSNSKTQGWCYVMAVVKNRTRQPV